MYISLFPFLLKVALTFEDRTFIGETMILVLRPLYIRARLDRKIPLPHLNPNLLSLVIQMGYIPASKQQAS